MAIEKMNIQRAYTVLGISGEIGTATLDEIKINYRLGALKYHPDKCKDPGAVDKFREIRAAYEYLNTHIGRDGVHEFCYYEDGVSDDESDKGKHSGDYKTMIGEFITKLFFKGVSSSGEDWKEDICRLVVSKLVGLCESKAMDYVDKIDRKTLAKLYSFIQKYREAFHLSDALIARIAEILANKEREPESETVVLLNPFLEDLQEDHLYRITESGKTFIVPLWHHELIYDNSGVDFVVRCCPVLPEHMEIDEHNNVYVYLWYYIKDVWGKDWMEVPFGNRTVGFHPKHLALTPEPQTIRLCKEGISQINANNPLDNTVRKDVVLVIQLTYVPEHISK